MNDFPLNNTIQINFYILIMCINLLNLVFENQNTRLSRFIHKIKKKILIGTVLLSGKSFIEPTKRVLEAFELCVTLILKLF